jgi:endonuclease/exonuclease/phosphatase (EEP) superfamily protein YafD
MRDSRRGYGIQPTWPAGVPALLIPLDHLLHTPDIVITSRRVGADAGSDHYPVIVEFFIDPGTPSG